MTQPTTELRNAASTNIDCLSTLEILQIMNREDQQVAEAVARELSSIAAAVDVITDKLRAGGRLLYIGAGTSGRLGVLDASECPPTFNTDPKQVVGIIAGGSRALTTAVEGAEDDEQQGIVDVQQQRLGQADALVGIATSGRTPYVLSAVRYARTVGAATIGLACSAGSLMEVEADIMITPVVGPEVISGSTRLKAGTATKLVLNMLTTASMVKLGKTYGNLMVDLRATNSKLKARSVRIVQELTELDFEAASALLARCGGEVKTAIVAEQCQLDPAAARVRLDSVAGHLRRALVNPDNS